MALRLIHAQRWIHIRIQTEPSCVHFLRIAVRLLEACGYGPNIAVPPEIVGTVSSKQASQQFKKSLSLTRRCTVQAPRLNNKNQCPSVQAPEDIRKYWKQHWSSVSLICNQWKEFSTYMLWSIYIIDISPIIAMLVVIKLWLLFFFGVTFDSEWLVVNVQLKAHSDTKDTKEGTLTPIYYPRWRSINEP